MRSTRKLLGPGVVAVALALAGCAPVSSSWGSGPGLQIGLSPGSGLSLFNAHCSLMGSPGYGSPLMRSGNAAMQAGARMQQVNQVQAKFQMASVGPTNREAWKSLAGGGC